MRIAFVNPEHPMSGTGHGGIATYIYTLSKALALKGHQVHVLVREGTLPDPLPSDVRIHFFKFSRSENRFARFADRFRDGAIVWEEGHARCVRDILVRIGDEEGLDIAEIPEYAGLAHKLFEPLSFHTVIHFHTPLEFVDQLNQTLVTRERIHRYRFERESLAKADAYKFPSEALKKYIHDNYQLNPGAVRIIRNAMDFEQFDKIDKVHDTAERFDILFSGRLECRKGAQIIQRSIKRIMQIDPKINLTFAGETELGDALSYRNAIERSLSDEERSRIWFLGSISRTKLITLYCRSSMLFLHSLFDNAPYTLFEAIAAKLPVVATDTGGINEVVRHNENGLLFPLGDTGGLIECIRLLFEHPEEGKRLAENAYREGVQLYDPGLIADQTLSFYEELLTKRS